MLVLIFQPVQLVLHEFHLTPFSLYRVATTHHGSLFLNVLTPHLRPIIEQIIAYENSRKEQQQQENSYILILAGALHTHYVVAKGVVSSGFLIELGIFPVVTVIDVPSVKCKCCYCGLVGNAEGDAGVGMLSHLQVMAHAICITERLLIGAVEIAEIGTVSVA